jgi:hypothetical protein
MEEVGDIDRLIERGLQLYGHGDVEGALRAWQQALAVDPDDVRASAYVDYVRENYEMLVSERRPVAEEAVPFGLGAVRGDAGQEPEYEVEVTRSGDERRAVERYIEQIDEGWFLDDELPEAWDHAEAREGINHPSHAHPPARPSRALPLPADDAEPEPITLELEAEEPDESDDRPLAASGLADDVEEQKTSDFSLRMPPTQEIQSPRGFVRPRLEGVPAPDDGDDSLKTRPGRGTGGPLDGTGEIRLGMSTDALSSFRSEFQTGGHGAIGPDERTREQPAVRVSFNPDSVDLPLPLDPRFVEEERTSERGLAQPVKPITVERYDSMSEQTAERTPRTVSPAPLDEGEGGKHPPLVIIEDPVLASPPPPDRSRAPTVDASALEDFEGGTKRIKRLSTDLGLGAVGPVPAPNTARSTADELAGRLDAEVDAGAPPNESKPDRTRRRVGVLIDRAVAASNAGDHGTAIVALDLALSEDPDSAITQKLIHRHQPAILDVYQRYLGDLGRRPALAIPMHELSNQKLDIRAAFLLSRIDGSLSFEEILDVAGMQRSEAFRHLSILVLRGILEVR